jgi:hypothetical protein
MPSIDRHRLTILDGARRIQTPGPATPWSAGCTLLRMDVPGYDHQPSSDPLSRLRNRLQRLHRLRGEPSVRELARRTEKAITHATVHMVLRCERTPKWGPLELVVEALGGSIEEYRQLWIAVRDAEDGIAAGTDVIVANQDGAVGQPERVFTVNPLPDWGAADRVATGPAGTARPDPAMYEFLVTELAPDPQSPGNSSVFARPGD